MTSLCWCCCCRQFVFACIDDLAGRFPSSCEPGARSEIRMCSWESERISRSCWPTYRRPWRLRMPWLSYPHKPQCIAHLARSAHDCRCGRGMRHIMLTSTKCGLCCTTLPGCTRLIHGACSSAFSVIRSERSPGCVASQSFIT